MSDETQSSEHNYVPTTAGMMLEEEQKFWKEIPEAFLLCKDETFEELDARLSEALLEAIKSVLAGNRTYPRLSYLERTMPSGRKMWIVSQPQIPEPLVTIIPGYESKVEDASDRKMWKHRTLIHKQGLISILTEHKTTAVFFTRPVWTFARR